MKILASGESLGARVKALRLELKKQQQQMADDLGISLRALQKMERDEGVPSGETLLQFERLGINPGWVLTGLGPKSLYDWYTTDSEAELFLSVGSMVQEEHERAGVPLPERSLLKTVRSILAEMQPDLDPGLDADERKHSLLFIEHAIVDWYNPHKASPFWETLGLVIVDIGDAQRKEDAGSTTPGNAHQVLLSKMWFEPGRDPLISRPQDSRPQNQ